MEAKTTGQYTKQIEEITNIKCGYSWLNDGTLKAETEALLTAAHEQALSTKSHKARIMKVSSDPSCRMCGRANETVAHILSACTELAATEYLKRHNNVARVVQWSMCKEYGIEVVSPYWKHEPQSVIETSKVKILWDFEIRTDHHIQARRPDIVLQDKEKKKTLIVDIAVPEDRNICQKEREKIDKYQDLKLEIQKLWNCKVRVIPIVVGVLGAYSPNLHKYLLVPGEHRERQLVKEALLGSAHILRRVLDLPESW